MTPPAITLPESVEELRVFALAMAEKAARADALEIEVSELKSLKADADARIERLTSILKAFDRARFGRRSEKHAKPEIDDEQSAFVEEPSKFGHRQSEAASAYQIGCRALQHILHPVLNTDGRGGSR